MDIYQKQMNLTVETHSYFDHSFHIAVYHPCNSLKAEINTDPVTSQLVKEDVSARGHLLWMQKEAVHQRTRGHVSLGTAEGITDLVQFRRLEEFAGDEAGEHADVIHCQGQSDGIVVGTCERHGMDFLLFVFIFKGLT